MGGFENGASDSFTYNIGDIGTFYAAKISNTGNDGWRLDTLTITINDDPPMIWAYDKWIDGNGSSENAPHADFFYADGTVASDAGLSATEIMMTCPAEFATCTADNTDFEPQTEDECASAATALGLELGGQDTLLQEATAPVAATRTSPALTQATRTGPLAPVASVAASTASRPSARPRSLPPLSAPTASASPRWTKSPLL